jgi:hypothetical protein
MAPLTVPLSRTNRRPSNRTAPERAMVTRYTGQVPKQGCRSSTTTAESASVPERDSVTGGSGAGRAHAADAASSAMTRAGRRLTA